MATARRTAITSTARSGCAKSTAAFASWSGDWTRPKSSIPTAPRDDDDADRVFFGATVDVRDGHGKKRTISIVGVDEIDTDRGYISWMSPMARALTKAREGDTVTLKTPGGVEELEILEVRYAPLASG